MIKILRVSKFFSKKGSFFFALLVVSLIGFSSSSFAQEVVNGKVYEAGTQTALEGVSVVNKMSQKGELTDRFGYFSLDAKVGDSIQIRLLGYLPKTIAIPPGAKIMTQNIYLTIRKFQLENVQILARPDFKRDSLLNRQENASIFNYKKPSVLNATLSTIFHPLSGLDNLIHSQRRRRLQNFQEKLETQEQDRYIDSRFTRQLVTSLTALQGEELEIFMKLYRPSYENLQSFSEYDLYEKIKEDFKDYVAFKASQPSTPHP